MCDFLIKKNLKSKKFGGTISKNSNSNMTIKKMGLYVDIGIILYPLGATRDIEQNKSL